MVLLTGLSHFAPWVLGKNCKDHKIVSEGKFLENCHIFLRTAATDVIECRGVMILKFIFFFCNSKALGT